QRAFLAFCDLFCILLAKFAIICYDSIRNGYIININLNTKGEIIPMEKELIIEQKVVTMNYDEVLNKFTPAIHKELKKEKIVFDRPSEERDDLLENESICLCKGLEKYEMS